MGETSLTPWEALSPGFRERGSGVGERASAWALGRKAAPRLHLGPHLPCMVAEGVGGSTG